MIPAAQPMTKLQQRGLSFGVDEGDGLEDSPSELLAEMMIVDISYGTKALHMCGASCTRGTQIKIGISPGNVRLRPREFKFQSM